MQSVFDHDTQAVKLALDSGMSLNWETETGLSPLSLAMFAGYEDLAIPFLNRGATMQEVALRRLARFMWTLPLLNAIVKSQGDNYFGVFELEFAIAHGAPKEVLDFLIKSPAMDSSVYRKASVFSALARSRIYSSRVQIREMAHRLLDAGFVPAQKDYLIEYYHASFAELFRKAEDSSLIGRFEFWEPHFPAPSQGDLNEQLSEVNSLEEADTLLRLGANPVAPLGRCTDGNGTDHSSALKVRISKDCQSNPLIPKSALDWQLAGHFLRHEPKGVGRLLNKKDSLFIFAVSGNPARMKAFVNSYLLKRLVVDSHTPDSNQALSLAAEVGDSAITAFLLEFPFSAKDKELALRSTMFGGSSGVVNLLLEKGAGARIASSGEAGLANLIELLFEWRRKFYSPSDTLIAKSLLSAYRKALPPSKAATLYPVSLAKLMQNRRRHPVLMDFLLRQIPGPLDPVEFYKNLGSNWGATGISSKTPSPCAGW